MIGECYHNKFHRTAPQCQNTEVEHAKPLGNFTDMWTWCQEHLPKYKPKEEEGDS